MSRAVLVVEPTTSSVVRDLVVQVLARRGDGPAIAAPAEVPATPGDFLVVDLPRVPTDLLRDPRPALWLVHGEATEEDALFHAREARGTAMH